MMTGNRERYQFYIEIPIYVQEVLDCLTAVGHEAYIVGGCVRDAMMGRTPEDWDVCTSALPEETLAVFAEEKTVETGMKHGTVAVIKGEYTVEITTYRIDGEYKDGRHPETVAFTRSLQEDLARRDFTINAMAYHPNAGVVDPYGGREDLKSSLIRCVGEPTKRFQEDALRIMRGLRFAATLGFLIEDDTATAMGAEKERLKDISKERINVELSKLLMGQQADEILQRFPDVLQAAAEGLKLPKSKLAIMPKILAIRLAEVFPKDTGKYLRLLKYDGNSIRWARVLSKLKDVPAPIEPKKAMIHFLAKHGEEIAVMHYARAGEKELTALIKVLEEEPCYRISDLAVTGNDLIEAGMSPGPAMGETLNRLLNLVIEEEIENTKEALLAVTKKEIEYE